MSHLPAATARWLRLAFWLASALTGTLALVPAELQPRIAANDKVEHFVAFLVLTVLYYASHGAQRLWRGALALSAFGALIELAQAVPIVHRDADVRDWLVDSAAILVVVCAAWALRAPRA